MSGKIVGVIGSCMRPLARSLLRLLYRTGVLRLLHGLGPRRLTVLVYHRVVDPEAPGFVGLRANVSATPAQLDAQLDLLGRWFDVIPLDRLLDWLAGRAELPPRPALITFDDGYRDNHTHALPALRARHLPAVLFLATGCVGSRSPFAWDLAAYCFASTRHSEADLPLLGHRRWHGARGRAGVLHAWLESLKSRPHDELAGHLGALQAVLEVEVRADVFAHQHLDWARIRELASAGVAIGAHTHSHPILSRVRPEQACAEIAESRRRIEAELGSAVRAFAFPNGRPQDYRPADVAALRAMGFAAAFTTVEGPMTAQAAQRQPLEIRRIMIMADDEIAVFAAALIGLGRIRRRMRCAMAAPGLARSRLAFRLAAVAAWPWRSAAAPRSGMGRP